MLKTVLILCFIYDTFGRDYYNLLEVSRTATEKQIKAAYRKLSIKYHPDKVTDMGKEQAERRYAEIAEAYTVLSDAEKRRIYDAGGEEALKRQEGGGGGGGGGPINNIQDLFKRFAGGGGGGGAQKEAKEGPVMTALVDTDVRELYTGAFLDVVLAHRAQCPKCSGTGARGGAKSKCGKCNGSGYTMEQKQLMGFGFVQQQVMCDKCQGTGKVVANKCTRCKGEGTVLSEDKLTIDVEKGSKNGEEILLPDMGDWGLDYDYGKLLLIVRESSLAPVILPMNATNLTALERRQNLKTLSFSSNQTSRDVLHSCRYRRAGDDLYVEYEISLKEALIGFVGNITHLDGHLVQVSRAGRCTHHGLVDVVYNEGMPKKDEVSYGVFGNMYVLFNVFFPKHLSDQQLAFVDQLFPPPLDSTNSTNTNIINNNNIKTNGNRNNNNNEL